MRYLITLFFLSMQMAPGWTASWPQPVFVPVAKGLDRPVHINHAGDGSQRLFVVEQPGRIRIVEKGILAPTPFLDITDRVGCCGERGLLSVAFPPDYGNKGYFYVNYTDKSGNTAVSRFYLSNEVNLADATREEIVLTLEQPATNHNGGQIAFGPDGFLYIGTGDGGSAGDPFRSGQNPNSLLGKMLRIDVETGVKPYAIPPDNPFRESAGFRPEIWALGLRNPWRFSFDRESGCLYTADVGQDQFEEVNVQSANSPGGENYGWNTMEGLHCFNQANCNQSGFTLPVLEYDHSHGDESITGGIVYRGDAFPRMRGVYFFGDFVSGRIAGLRRVGNQWEVTVFTDTDFGISSFGEDEGGGAYLADLAGTVYRIEDSVRTSQLNFEGLLPRYLPGDTLKVNTQETTSKRSFIADLWVAIKPPNGPLLYVTANATQLLSEQPQPFARQVDTDATRHAVLNVPVPPDTVPGPYTFYAIYTESGTDLGALSLALRSNIAQAVAVVEK